MSLFVWNDVAVKYLNQFYTKYKEEIGNDRYAAMVGDLSTPPFISDRLSRQRMN